MLCFAVLCSGLPGASSEGPIPCLSPPAGWRLEAGGWSWWGGRTEKGRRVHQVPSARSQSGVDTGRCQPAQPPPLFIFILEKKLLTGRTRYGAKLFESTSSFARDLEVHGRVSALFAIVNSIEI